MPERHAASYVAALIDGEGSVGDHQVTITNTDIDLVSVCCECLDEMGVEYSFGWRRRPGCRPVCTIWITGRGNLELLQRLTPLAPTKAARLRKDLGRYKQRHLRRSEIPDVALREAYGHGLRGEALAQKFGVSSSTLYGWMDRAGIKRSARWEPVNV